MPADILQEVKMKNVFVQLAHDPRQQFILPFIEDGEGVAKFSGPMPSTFWSVEVIGGKRVNPLRAGDRVIISGIDTDTGKSFAIPTILACQDPGDPANFIQPIIPLTSDTGDVHIHVHR